MATEKNGNGTRERKPFSNKERAQTLELHMKACQDLKVTTAKLKKIKDTIERLEEDWKAGGYIEDQPQLPIGDDEQGDQPQA